MSQQSVPNGEEAGDRRFCRSLEGVSLFRRFALQIDSAAGSASVVAQPKEETLVNNLVQVAQQEHATIKELTDFEQGLQFATHRMLDLKQLLFNYTQNPCYQDKVSFEGSQDELDSEIRELVEKLVQMEQSEINTRLFYESFIQKHKALLEDWKKIQ